MRYEWLSDYCTAKAGAVKEYKVEWECVRYLVGGKMFLMDGRDDRGSHIFTLKLKPENGQFMRDQYPDIVPGYYMNKLHWNSIRADGDVPDDEFKQMLDESYRLVFLSLSKKARQEISG